MSGRNCGHKKCDDLCKILDEVTHNIEEMTARAFEGLLRHSRKKLEEAEQLGVIVERDTKRLTELVLLAGDGPGIIGSNRIIEVANELQRVEYSLDKIIASIRNKIDDGVLFSEKAVLELKDFFAGVIDNLKHIHDLVLTNNPVLASHIIKNAEGFEEVARKYADEHEDRLIKGICLPKSSLIYLLVLDSLKDILRYIKGVAQVYTEDK